MKDKILVFIIGLLVGAIIATAICYVHEKKVLAEVEEQKTQMQNFGPGGMNGQRPEGMKGEIKGNKDSNTTDEETEESDEDRPELPDGEIPDFDDENRPTPPDGEFNPEDMENMTPPDIQNKTRTEKTSSEE